MTMLVIGIIFGAGASFVLTGIWAMACYRDAIDGLKREMACQTRNELLTKEQRQDAIDLLQTIMDTNLEIEPLTEDECYLLSSYIEEHERRAQIIAGEKE